MDARSPTHYGQSPSQSQYKVNVNRTKTKKWIHAPVQTYDGDDWGSEDAFVNPEAAHDAAGVAILQQSSQRPQPQRPGRLTPGLRTVSSDTAPSTAPLSVRTTSASLNLRPSERIALDKQAAAQRCATSPPAPPNHDCKPTQPQLQIPSQMAAPSGPSAANSSSSSSPSFLTSPKNGLASQEGPDLTDPAAPPSPRTTPRPLGSASRPSLDGLDCPTPVGDGSGGGRNNSAEGNRNSRTLEPLHLAVERRNEDGSDGLTVKPGDPPPPPPAAQVSCATVVQLQPDPAEKTHTRSQPEPESPDQPSAAVLHHPQATRQPRGAAEPVKRYSVSPKLPLLTRVSGFGSDLFGTGGLGFMSQSQMQTEQPVDSTLTPQDAVAGAQTTNPGQPRSSTLTEPSAEPPTRQSPPLPTATAQDTPTSSDQSDMSPAYLPPASPTIAESSPTEHPQLSISEQCVSETATTPGDMATPGSYLAVTPTDVLDPISEQPERAHLMPAPLRTPSPGGESLKETEDDGNQFNGLASPSSPTTSPVLTTRPLERSQDDDPAAKDVLGGEEVPRHVAPIAPLQPRKGSVPEMRLHPTTGMDSICTTDHLSSPVKESDALRDEIIQSLSPVRPSDGSRRVPEHAHAGRESAYLGDVYDDYWSGDDKETEPVPKVKNSSREATSSPPSPPAHAPSEAPVLAAEQQQSTVAAKPDDVTAGLKRERFSWEAAPEVDKSAQQSTVAHPALSDSTRDSTTPTSAAPAAAAGQAPRASGASAAPESTDLVKHGKTSQLARLPTLDLGDSDMTSRMVPGVSKSSPGQSDSAVKVRSRSPSPLPNVAHRDGPSQAISDVGDMASPPLSDEKLVVESPVALLSPRDPIGLVDSKERPQETREATTSFSFAQTSPEGVPLPRSPSPTKPGPDEEERQSQPGHNTMSLKQILQLPGTAERVQMMQATREYVATVDLGLSNWLEELLSQPVHENAMPTFNYELGGADAELWGGRHNAGPGEEGNFGGGRAAQHSNMAGGASVTRTGSGSLNMGHLVMHSGQAGAKGKELLHSAGKMGKGLLNKGKNKLRERTESKRY